MLKKVSLAVLTLIFVTLLLPARYVEAQLNRVSVNQIIGTLGPAKGGTGNASYTVGDILYASAATTLSRLTAVGAGQVLASAGATTAPAYTTTPTVVKICYGVGATTCTDAKAASETTFLLTAIADNTATTAFTVTLPNQSGAAMIKVIAIASLGAGGAVGAFEASCAGEWINVVTRPSGVIAGQAGSSLSESSGSAAATGGTSCTLARSFGSAGGTAGQPTTFTQQVTVSHGTGSSTNHQVLFHVLILNTAANGATIG